MDLIQGFRVNPGECIAFCGSGGKTTAIFSLAHQLDGPVFVTTTTHLGADQVALADQVIIIDDQSNIENIIRQVGDEVVLLVGGRLEPQRLTGIPNGKLAEIFEYTKHNGHNLLIEADGSRQLPLKAPATHEPVVPPFVDCVVVVAGLSALGKPLTSEWVHRPEIFSKLSSLSLGDQITPKSISQVLGDIRGGLQGIPPGARRLCLLNQADIKKLQSQARWIARDLLSHYEAVLITTCIRKRSEVDRDEKDSKDMAARCNVLAVEEQIAAIILAAGGSNRMGTAKQMLPWRGEPLVLHVVRAAIEAEFAHIFIIIGAAGDEVKAAIRGLPIKIVENPEWQSGQSSSVRAGLAELPKGLGGVVFLLADQPHVSSGLMKALIERHANTLSPIVAPLVHGQRGNPVLFDRTTFIDLHKVQGDTGGRAIFSKYPIEWLDWVDESILLDIDSEEDYRRLLSSQN
ncbi:MAG: putative selenium-dependent hydroxylase accessory protein YqeC [Chloroflexota bacterium]|nr:MAG: putative selenium-dependent hydroxylase accessory protein YqeC [Chloroflexota bacterium]